MHLPQISYSIGNENCSSCIHDFVSLVIVQHYITNTYKSEKLIALSGTIWDFYCESNGHSLQFTEIRSCDCEKLSFKTSVVHSIGPIHCWISNTRQYNIIAFKILQPRSMRYAAHTRPKMKRVKAQTRSRLFSVVVAE